MTTFDSATSATLLRGTPVVPGVVAGPVVHVRDEISPEAIERFGDGGFADADAAMEAYDGAAAAVADDFTARAAAVSDGAAAVLTASAGLARDKGLRAAVVKGLGEGGGPVAAVRAAVDQFATVFASMGGLMAERVTDLRDIERRLIAHLVGEPQPGVPVPDEPSVVVASDLAPSDTSGLDPERVLALVTERGGATSHTAIIARQLGIPCVAGTSGVTDLDEGAFVVVDGEAGTVEVGADPDEAARRVAASLERRAALAAWTGPAATADGVPVKLLANVIDGPSAELAAKEPVTGVGLFRTEMCFLDRTEEPSVEEQADIYAAVLAPFAGRHHVVVRTLDAGSDKPIAFAAHEDEENPALGVRGLRLSIDNPGLMDRQLDAIALAAERTGAEAWVMAPMVATVDEAAGFAALVRDRGLRAGVMVEVPSAALLADRMLEVVDFLSIGTNDLTQYAMAADRMATDLAYLTDPWQPAVLQLISMTALAGAAADKPVGVCGEAAADPLLATALIGMGITSLSMAARAVRPVGAQLSEVTQDVCRAAADAALSAADPMAGRAAVREVLGH
ncbi:phosphoenolpyruvate--protein phosphotransferase [Nocardioides sp. YIM 152588]|uniref:phosphoenolpyruvate--protein phosphotransferase n=1 Tax=Nocardioides sp. YIM 152588 TaxID=3158259 RepID=UPI0032E49364